MLSAADRKLIHDVAISDGLRFGGAGGVVRTRVLTFSVGTQGPFTHVLDLVNYNAANIEAAYEQELTTLRAAGVPLTQA
jgi:hypothetical protein